MRSATAVCTTNPVFGRGLSLALWGAVALSDSVTELARDRLELAMALDGQVATHVAPFYEDQAAIDGARMAMLRHSIFGEPAPAPPAVAPDRVGMNEIRTAARFDPTAFRALWTHSGMLRVPEEIYTDPEVVAATHGALRRHGSGPPTAQPTRDELLAALG